MAELVGMIVIVGVDVIAPVIVAVHLNGNATVVVILPAGECDATVVNPGRAIMPLASFRRDLDRRWDPITPAVSITITSRATATNHG